MKNIYILDDKGSDFLSSPIYVHLKFNQPQNSKIDYQGCIVALDSGAEIAAPLITLGGEAVAISSEILGSKVSRYVIIVEANSKFEEAEPSFSYFRHPKLSLRSGKNAMVEEYYRSALNRFGIIMVLGEIQYNDGHWVFKSMQEVLKGGIAEYQKRYKKRDPLLGWI